MISASEMPAGLEIRREIQINSEQLNVHIYVQIIRSSPVLGVIHPILLQWYQSIPISKQRHVWVGGIKRDVAETGKTALSHPPFPKTRHVAKRK